MKHGLEASFEKRHPGGPIIRIGDCNALTENLVTVLFGASGSGKTTVLRCLAGLDRPDAGHIRFKGELWSDNSNRTFMPTRLRRIGLVPQDDALFPHMTVEGNVSYGLSELNASARRQRIGETLAWLGITGLEKRWPAELSGGQRQRVALARALAPRPRLLLLDEPLSALDHPTRVRLRRDLRGWLNEAGIPAILVTHDRTEAATLGDEIIVMHEGRMIQQGSIADVLSKPVSHDVAGILAVETIVPGEIITIRDGIATVQVNGIPLQALAEDLPEGTRQVFVCIRAEDVSISSADPAASSPRNRLPCIITACSREGPLVRIDLDCGFPLHALLTPQSCEEMTLTTGIPTTAVIKAPKVHLIPR